MKVEFHSAVAQDIASAQNYYESVSELLGNEFESELRKLIQAAVENPQRFHFAKPGIRRANLRRFPYHFLYREIAGGIRITVLRHHRRHPDYGSERK